MREARLEMRKVVIVKIGDTLSFEPASGAIGGPESAFFEKYRGMEVEVLGFEEDDLATFGRMLGVRKPRKAAAGGTKVGSFFVRFENGDEPSHSINSVHFVVP
jgi:hypothetical protein